MVTSRSGTVISMVSGMFNVLVVIGSIDVVINFANNLIGFSYEQPGSNEFDRRYVSILVTLAELSNRAGCPIVDLVVEHK